MMDANELAAFIDLPEELLAFRGALAHNHAGLCWSVDSGEAALYALRYASCLTQSSHRRPTAYRLTARIDKSHVIATKLLEGKLTLLVGQVD